MAARRFRLLLCLVAGLGADASLSEADRGKAEKAVRAVLEEQVEAWNAGKLERFMDTYWKSDKLVFFSGGIVTKGHKALAERYRKNYQGEGKEMGKLTFSDVEVEALSADTAHARGVWKVVTSKETVEGLFTLLLRKMPDGWKIVHDHTSRADPPKSR